MAAADLGYRLARPVLFRLGGGDAESAHHRTLGWLASVARHPAALGTLRKLLLVDHSPRRVFGVTFPSAVGLAAGMDKDGVALPAWAAMGFGFTEVGTVTAQAQSGNDRPRLFRLKQSRALVNRMGFNNAGAAALAGRLEALGPLPTPLGISIGKSKVAPVDEAVGDYLVSARLLAPHADYLAVNVSSPNTPGLRSLQDRGPLTELLGALTTELATGGHRVPVLVKIAPDLADDAIGELLQVATDTDVAGIIATNTTLGRNGLDPADAAVGGQAGGLSGAPLTRRARDVVAFVAGRSELPVIGVGGIMTPDDGLSMLDAGAALLQLYTGFVYAGPGLVQQLHRRIAAAEPGRHG